MAMPENALMTLTDAQVELILKNEDTGGMTPEEKYEYALVLYEDKVQTMQGFMPRPQQLKINKESRQFVDSLGNSYDEVRGIMLHRMMTSGYWIKKSKVPVCSSLDCKTGMVALDPILFDAARSVFPDLHDYDFATLASMDPFSAEKILTRKCKGCPMTAWGSAVGDDGEPRRGKACKEMRRIYLFQRDAMLPVKISLPPTSVTAWDDYISARVTQKIFDLMAEAVLRLIPKESGGYTVAAIDPRMGPRLKPAEVLQFSRLRRQFVDIWEKEKVTADDYDNDTSDAPAGPDAAGDYEPW